MARVRTNNVFGTTTDAPLLVGATTVNAAGLTNLGVVTGGAEAVITLDPNRVNGAPEIVRVSAHSSAATSATISRGEFGTSAREHPAGTEWVHGPVAEATDPGDFGGFWADYTPSNTNITVGNGTQVARWTRVGNIVTVEWQLTFGSTTAFTGNALVGLPVTAKSGARFIGSASYNDTGTAIYSGSGSIGVIDFTTALLNHSGGTFTNGNVDATHPMTWTTADVASLTITYEAA